MEEMEIALPTCEELDVVSVQKTEKNIRPLSKMRGDNIWVTYFLRLGHEGGETENLCEKEKRREGMGIQQMKKNLRKLISKG